ncbi:hypothetical protein NDU88_002070 [Pleurodeles waltl]|uniref:Uncharacterized protein n=1 Tax=Pleurodeles waltl TaxID=8319 RepID=A0AAV7L094_PLEWA|nr:hypothetical protein NDU88_002070 [Pleurodeles waltl]
MSWAPRLLLGVGIGATEGGARAGGAEPERSRSRSRADPQLSGGRRAGRRGVPGSALMEKGEQSSVHAGCAVPLSVQSQEAGARAGCDPGEAAMLRTGGVEGCRKSCSAPGEGARDAVHCSCSSLTPGAVEAAGAAGSNLIRLAEGEGTGALSHGPCGGSDPAGRQGLWERQGAGDAHSVPLKSESPGGCSSR